jgi:hypothetical protein
MLATRVGRLYVEQLFNYFLCEAREVDPNNPGLCDEFRDGFRELSFPELKATSFILINLLPTVYLLYTLNFGELKGKLMNFRAKRRRVDSQSNTDMQSTGVTESH